MNDFETFSDGAEESILVNLSEVESMSFTPIPKGKYPLVIEECEFQISKSSGKPMWSVRFSVTEGEYENRKLFNYMSFSEKALGMTKANLAALGANDLLEGSFNPKTVADEGKLIGMTAIGVIDIEKGTDGNEDRNRVKRLETAGSADADGGFTI